MLGSLVVHTSARKEPFGELQIASPVALIKWVWSGAPESDFRTNTFSLFNICWIKLGGIGCYDEQGDRGVERTR